MLFLLPQIHFSHCQTTNGKCYKQKKNVFYLTEHLIHAVKILTVVSTISDMEELVVFLPFSNFMTTLKHCLQYQLKIPIHIIAVCQQHIRHIKYKCFLYRASAISF